ncbi:hypothetical protein HID58_017266 [Brassica napus]|uniref:CCHC-type domain-containing protein n=1 Tax=Brassica napus TaxID=3708 RepID=A0ABQ8D6L4_BRANA|nr:hypothetical protein HID58_017266 [Brassica napus]
MKEHLQLYLILSSETKNIINPLKGESSYLYDKSSLATTMADHCMIIAGEWKTSGDGSWNFSIDKHQMSRILTLSPSMTLLELQNNVLDEFFPNTQTRPEASLSYWPPNSKELATGISTPPVMLTHDGSVSFFYRHFEVQKAMNLFVTFNHLSDPVHTSQVAENLFPFTTPDQPITKPPHLLNRYSGPRPPTSGLSPPSKIPCFSLFPDGDLFGASPSKPSNTTNSPHSTPSKIRRFSLIDETVLCSDDMLEEMFKSDSDNIPDSWRTEAEEEEVIGPDSPLPPGFEEVQPRGYDHEFWDPLIAKHLGGSDAEQVFAGIDVPKTAPYNVDNTYASTETSPAVPPTTQKPDPEDPTSHHHSFTHVYPNPMDTSTPQSVPSTTTPHRRYPHGQPATPSAGAQRQTNPHGQSNFTPTGVHKSSTPHVHPTSNPCTPTPRSNNHPPPKTITSVILFPPLTRRPSGRPKENRIASTGEIPAPKKKKLVPNKCGRCGGTGHNRTNCVLPI